MSAPTPALTKRLQELVGDERGAQADLARDLDVSRAAVAQWVTGKSAPSDKNLRSIAHALGDGNATLLDLLDLKYPADPQEAA